MSKSKNIDINQVVMNAHKLAVKNAIETSIRFGTPLVAVVDNKVKLIQPKYKYVRVPVQKKSVRKKNS